MRVTDHLDPPPAMTMAMAMATHKQHVMGGSGGGGASASPRDLMMVALSRFYSDSARIERVVPYVTGQSDESLRLIDWFVTNYARNKHVVIWNPTTSTPFNVYLSYRAQLKAYSKQMFDPFRRRDRILFNFGGESSVETTVGQLNFFRWMLLNGVLDYVVAHREDIERDMPTSSAPPPPTPGSGSKQQSRQSADVSDAPPPGGMPDQPPSSHAADHPHAAIMRVRGQHKLSFE